MALAASGFVTQLVALVGALAILALYAPRQVGAAAAFTAFVGVTSLVASLRYDVALPMTTDEDLADHVALCFVVVGLVSIAAGVVALVAEPLVLHGATAAGLRFAVAPVVGVVGVSHVLTELATRERTFVSLARIRVLQALAVVGAQCALGLLGAGAAGLVVAYVLGATVLTVGLGRDLIPVLQRARAVDVAALGRVGRMYRAFPMLSSFSTLCQGVLTTCLPLVTAVAYGLPAAGLVAVAQRLLSAPIRMVGEPLSRTLLGDAAALSREDPARISRRVRDTTVATAIVATPVAVAVFVVGPGLFHLLGSRWAAAAPVARPLAMLFLVQMVYVVLNPTFIVVQRLGAQAMVVASQVIGGFGSFAVAYHMGVNITGAVWAFAVGAGLCYVGGIAVIGLLARSLGGSPR